MPLSNPVSEPQIPSTITRDIELAAHETAGNPHTQYLPKNPIAIEFALGDVNVIDLHVKPSPSSIDFDVRFIASDGRSENGRGTLTLQARLFNLLCGVAIAGGAQIARFLMVSTYIDLPVIAPGGVYDIYVSIPGAQVGDVAFFLPTGELYNGLWTIQTQASVTNNNNARIYFHNLNQAAVDVAAFSGKLLVIGFA